MLVRDDAIVDRYQSLMNPGVSIPYDIQSLTGISNEMVRRAPPVHEVMTQAVQFVGACPIVAHNAAFDRKFWDTELAALRLASTNSFLCSLLLSRRVFSQYSSHKLETLVRVLRLPTAGAFHRAAADAECTAHLFIRLQQEIAQRFELAGIDCGLLQKVQSVSRHKLESCVRDYHALSESQ